MSLELINTLGTVTTVVIVAATAIAALVQLRHLRAGNQINAMLEIGQKLSIKSFTDAVETLRKLDAAMRDPGYRNYEIALARNQDPGDVDPTHEQLRRATILVGNSYEELGILVKRGIVDREMFLDRYCYLILSAWRRLEQVTALAREVTSPLAWENFEYIAVLSEDWMKLHASGTYPSRVRRMKLTNQWQVSTTPSMA